MDASSISVRPKSQRWRKAKLEVDGTEDQRTRGCAADTRERQRQPRPSTALAHDGTFAREDRLLDGWHGCAEEDCKLYNYSQLDLSGHIA